MGRGSYDPAERMLATVQELQLPAVRSLHEVLLGELGGGGGGAGAGEDAEGERERRHVHGKRHKLPLRKMTSSEGDRQREKRGDGMGVGVKEDGEEEESEEQGDGVGSEDQSECEGEDEGEGEGEGGQGAGAATAAFVQPQEGTDREGGAFHGDTDGHFVGVQRLIEQHSHTQGHGSRQAASPSLAPPTGGNQHINRPLPPPPGKETDAAKRYAKASLKLPGNNAVTAGWSLEQQQGQQREAGRPDSASTATSAVTGLTEEGGESDLDSGSEVRLQSSGHSSGRGHPSCIGFRFGRRKDQRKGQGRSGGSGSKGRRAKEQKRSLFRFMLFGKRGEGDKEQEGEAEEDEDEGLGQTLGMTSFVPLRLGYAATTDVESDGITDIKALESDPPDIVKSGKSEEASKKGGDGTGQETPAAGGTEEAMERGGGGSFRGM